MSAVARSAAPRSSSSCRPKDSSCPACLLASSPRLVMTVSRLLKSWAALPASLRMASSRSDRRTWPFEISRLRDVAEAPHPASRLPVLPVRDGIPLEGPAVLELQHVERFGLRLGVELSNLAQELLRVLELVEDVRDQGGVVAHGQHRAGDSPELREPMIERLHAAPVVHHQDAVRSGVEGRTQDGYGSPHLLLRAMTLEGGHDLACREGQDLLLPFSVSRGVGPRSNRQSAEGLLSGPQGHAQPAPQGVAAPAFGRSRGQEGLARLHDLRGPFIRERPRPGHDRRLPGEVGAGELRGRRVLEHDPEALRPHERAKRGSDPGIEVGHVGGGLRLLGHEIERGAHGLGVLPLGDVPHHSRERGPGLASTFSEGDLHRDLAAALVARDELDRMPVHVLATGGDVAREGGSGDARAGRPASAW